MAANEVEVLVMKAAGDLRRAAALDDKRRAELESLADYLESIVYEKELGYGEPIFPSAPEKSETPEEEIRRMIKPFRIRLTR